MTTMTGPSTLGSNNKTAFIASPTSKNSEARPECNEMVHACADGSTASDLRSQYQSMEGPHESQDAQSATPQKAATPVAVRGIGGGAALPGWSRVDRPQGPSIGDYLGNDQRWQGLLDGEGGVVLAPTCSYSRDKRTSSLGLRVRAQTLVSSSSRSLFSESGAQEGQGSGKDEDQGLETPYMALSSEGLPPPMANTGGQSGPGATLTSHSTQARHEHATSSSALCPNGGPDSHGPTRRRKGVLWSLARKVSSAFTLFPDRNDNLQKLPSAVSRLPLPAEVEGYTMMYEPPLHTPSPPRPNTSQANGSGTGNGSGLEASGYVSPPPVPCLQVDAPQQEDVFRASEMWTLRTVLARLQAQHRHCQANGTDTPQAVLEELVEVEGRLQSLAHEEAQRWEDLAAQQLHALQQQRAPFQMTHTQGGKNVSWQPAQSDVSQAGSVGASQGGGARFRTFSHQSGRLEHTQAASNEWMPLPDA